MKEEEIFNKLKTLADELEEANQRSKEHNVVIATIYTIIGAMMGDSLETLGKEMVKVNEKLLIKVKGKLLLLNELNNREN